MYHVSAQGIDEAHDKCTLLLLHQAETREPSLGFHWYDVSSGNLRWGFTRTVSAQGTFAGVPPVQCQLREPSLGFHWYCVSTGYLRWGSTRTVSAQRTFAGVPPVQCQHREPSLGFHSYSVSSGDHDHFCAQGTLTRNNQRGRER